MKKLKLIIISIHIKNSPQAMPLAAGLLKAQLDSEPDLNAGIDTSFIDFYMDSSADTIAESVISMTPDMAGFSVYLWNRHLIEEACRIIRNKFPYIKLFAGGAEATAQPVHLLNRAPFDFVVKGEGETALKDVMKNIISGKPYNHIPGVFVKHCAYSSIDDQSPVADLDAIPSPFLEKIIDIRKYQGVLWELSRGCPFKCSFCFESKGIAGVRQYSIERLQKELELFESEKVKQVFVLDPTFNRDMKRAKTILRMIADTAPLIHFTFEVRTEYLDAEMADLFSSINCSLQIGLQSALPEVLSNVNRTISPDKYADKIALLNNAGVIFGLDLIYGLPGDSIEGFRYSLNYALTLQPNHIDIFPLAVLPGTALYDKADSCKLEFLPEAPYTLISSPDFTEADMSAAERLKDSCSIFYNIGGAAGWMFMITETLGIEPADLLDSFSTYLTGKNILSEPSREETTRLQTGFVKELFSKYNFQNLFPVMEDIILFHGALNRSLYNGPCEGADRYSINENSVFILAPGTVFLTLKHNFDDLMTVGEFTLEEFIIRYSPEKTYLTVYNKQGEVKPLITEKKYNHALQMFTGDYSLNDILKKNSSISKDDFFDFIEYAVSETIITVR